MFGTTVTAKGSSIDDIDNRCLLNMLDVRRKRWAPSTILEHLSWVVRVSDAIVVWGKTLAASGGTLGFLWSLLYWFDFSRYVINSPSLFWLASFTFACLLPIGASLVPNVRNRTRGWSLSGRRSSFCQSGPMITRMPWTSCPYYSCFP